MSARASMARDRRSRRSPLGCRKRDGPECSFGARQRLRKRKRSAAPNTPVAPPVVESLGPRPGDPARYAVRSNARATVRHRGVRSLAKPSRPREGVRRRPGAQRRDEPFGRKGHKPDERPRVAPRRRGSAAGPLLNSPR